MISRRVVVGLVVLLAVAGPVFGEEDLGEPALDAFESGGETTADWGGAPPGAFDDPQGHYGRMSDRYLGEFAELNEYRGPAPVGAAPTPALPTTPPTAGGASAATEATPSGYYGTGLSDRAAAP